MATGWEQIRKIKQRLSREQGTVYKDWGGRLPVALVCPSSYYVGMSNLGIQAIYRLLNDHPRIVCERVFWDRDYPDSPLSLETQRPLSDFAVLAFSVTYELDYFHAVSLLKASGIPLYATDRDRHHPLVIAGGPCITANPLPLAPFFDCLCIGEAESLLPTMMPLVTDGIRENRVDLLKSLATANGIYVPQHNQGKPITRQWAEDLDKFPVHSEVLTLDTELGNLYLIEVERGCDWGCRFCLAGETFSPARYRSVDGLLQQAETGLKYRKRLGLVGAAVIDHPQIEELITGLRHLGAGLSISSLRIKPFSATVVGEVVKSGARSLALAPEAGSQRLRRLIRKGFSENDILAAVSQVADSGVKQLKLYFMLGLPTETDEDAEAIVELSLKVKAVLDRQSGGSRLTLNIAPFVPKANTTFQWLPIAPKEVLLKRLTLVNNTLAPAGIRVNSESLAWSEVQAILARGDTDVAAILASMDGLSLSSWRRSVAKCHFDADYYAHQRWETSRPLPWAIISPPGQTSRL